MPKNKKRHDVSFITEGEDEGSWITTYADMVTLLLVFFVMLFAISTLDMQKFMAIAAQLQKSFGKPTAQISLVVPDVSKTDAPGDISQASSAPEPVKDIPPELLEELEEIDKSLLQDVQALVEKKRIGDNIVVYQEKNRITITVEGQIFFGSGSSDIMSGALPLLDEISNIIVKHPNYRINIKGHTDDRPIETSQFPSNWELSAVRATTVLRYLLSQGIDPTRLTATGYGSLLPVAPNDTPENRAKNRRVEFVLEKEKKG